MMLDALLTDLAAVGIQPYARDGHLRVTAPKGALTPELRAALSEHKGALLALLTPQNEPPAGTCTCGEPMRLHNRAVCLIPGQYLAWCDTPDCGYAELVAR